MAGQLNEVCAPLLKVLFDSPLAIADGVCQRFELFCARIARHVAFCWGPTQLKDKDRLLHLSHALKEWRLDEHLGDDAAKRELVLEHPLWVDNAPNAPHIDSWTVLAMAKK